MTPPADPARYKHHRFPGEIISHGVWLYYRFPLSYRDVQERLCERGIDVTHEAIRQWCLNLAPYGRTLLISDVLDTFPTASSYPHVCQRELCQGLCPSPARSRSWGAPSAGTIPPPLDRLHLVIDDAVTRMPHLPQQHLPAATPTP